MKLFLFFIVYTITLTANAFTSYSGFLGSQPIKLVLDPRSDGDVSAVYAYDKYDTPIKLDGNIKGKKLTLYEKNAAGKIIATLTFNDFDIKKYKLRGFWQHLVTKKRFAISLGERFTLGDANVLESQPREFLVSESTDKHYFMLLVIQKKDDYAASTVGVNILEKNTDRLIQSIKLEGQFRGFYSFSIGDYNFDGLTDFSVFESSYTGTNTSRLYILRKPRSDKYFISDFSGTSLHFDAKSKTIYGQNQCCGGATYTNYEYKVVNNKMVLMKKTCIKDDYNSNIECD